MIWIELCISVVCITWLWLKYDKVNNELTRTKHWYEDTQKYNEYLRTQLSECRNENKDLEDKNLELSTGYQGLVADIQERINR